MTPDIHKNRSLIPSVEIPRGMVGWSLVGWYKFIPPNRNVLRPKLQQPTALDEFIYFISISALWASHSFSATPAMMQKRAHRGIVPLWTWIGWVGERWVGWGLEFCIWCLKMFWKCDLFHALGKFLMVYFSCARLRWISVGSSGPWSCKWGRGERRFMWNAFMEISRSPAAVADRVRWRAIRSNFWQPNFSSVASLGCNTTPFRSKCAEGRK